MSGPCVPRCEGACVYACFSPGTEAILWPGLALRPAAIVDSSLLPTPRAEGPSQPPVPTAHCQSCQRNAHSVSTSGHLSCFSKENSVSP